MTETGQVSCPHCGQLYAMAAEQRAQYEGRTIPCTQCGKPFTVSGGAAAAAPMSYARPAYSNAASEFVQPRASRVAVAALVLGIASFLVPILLSIPAIVCGAIGMSRGRGGRGFAISGLVLGILSTLFGLVSIPCMIGIFLPSLTRAREAANRVKCASNLRQLGLSMLQYSNEERDGAYPDTLEHLLAKSSLANAVFVCPAANDTPSTATGAAQVAVDLAAGGHDSYVYVGSGITNRMPAATVLMYENLSNHRNAGMNVLYADGRVSFLSRVQAQALIASLQTRPNVSAPSPGTP